MPGRNDTRACETQKEQRQTFPRCSLLPEWAVIRCGGSGPGRKVEEGVNP
jgi:hypothetical protein